MEVLHGLVKVSKDKIEEEAEQSKEEKVATKNKIIQ